MRIHPSTQPGAAVSGRALQKAARQHSHGNKGGEHRYERRKVREYLRHTDAADDGAFDTVR